MGGDHVGLAVDLVGVRYEAAEQHFLIRAERTKVGGRRAGGGGGLELGEEHVIGMEEEALEVKV